MSGSVLKTTNILHLLRLFPRSPFPASSVVRIIYCCNYRPSQSVDHINSASSIAPFCFSRSLHGSALKFVQDNQLEKDKVNTTKKDESPQSEPVNQQTALNNPDGPAKMSIFQRFKRMYKDYWYVLIPVHCVTSVFWAGGFYFAVKNGLDVVALLESLGIGEKIINPLRNSSVGYYALTYALYKVASPARYAVTVGGTTVTINYLTRWGYIKPVPSSEKLQVLYQTRKAEFNVKRDNIRRKLRQHRADFKKRMSFGKKRVKK